MTRPGLRLSGIIFADEPNELGILMQHRVLLEMINDWMDVLYPHDSASG